MSKEALIRDLDRLFSSIGKHFTNARKGFTQRDVTGPEFFVLRLITVEGPKNVSQVAEHFNLNQATVSNIAHALHERGLVLKKKNPADRRVTLLYTTDRGRCIVEEIEAERFERLRRFLHHLSTEDLEDLVRIFSKLRSALQHHEK